MAKSSPAQHHNHWGEFAAAGNLPNVLGSALQDGDLDVGDFAYVTGVGSYQCDDATLGAASWSSLGASGPPSGLQSSIETARFIYTQQPVPVEEVLGQFMFDGSTIPAGGSVKLRCMMNPTLSVAGWARVHVYDLGPAAGPPAAPTRITGVSPSVYALEAVASGLVYLETAALAPGPGPAVGVIMLAPRMYEAVIIESSVPGDTVDVGFAGIYTEI